MCGIAGSFTPGAAVPDPVVAMTIALRHRGPDGAGLAISGGAAFGHARLAIHDLSAAGCQPFMDPGGQTIAVVNGEFYDADALRGDLERRGHVFRGRSDSEVVLPLWREKGPALVDDLHGPFAIAIADARRETLFLARDRVGKKPLFWARSGASILFSSEVGALAHAVGAARNPDAVHQVLRMGWIAAPATPFLGVHAVPPATTILFERDTITTSTYWTPPLEPDAAMDREAALPAVREALHAAVARRLHGERPLAVFLSGGLDSAAVLLLANEIAGAPLPAFTLGFDDPSADESHHARVVAQALGSPHTVFSFDDDPVAVVRDVIAKSGEMLADPSLIAWASLARKAAEHATVFLTGDGGDEALIGYRRHRAARIAASLPAILRATARTASRLPLGRAARRMIAAASGSPRDVLSDLAGLSPWRSLASFLHSDAIRAGDPLRALYDAIPVASEPAADAARLDLLTYLPGDLMPKADRGAMAFGIETRSPFLDDAFLETALRIPGRIRASWREGKLPLRAMLRGRIPDTILRRRKHGFAVPLDRMLRTGRLAAPARELLNDVTAPFAGVLAGDSAQRLHAAFARGEDCGELVYAAFVIALHHTTVRP